MDIAAHTNVTMCGQPDLDEFMRWQAASGGLVGMVTLSPHFEGIEVYIAKLASMGVLVAIGHTHATPQQIRAAVNAGACLSTHLGNGIAGVLPRHANPIWPQLANDSLSATFIADGHHLPADTFKSMLRAKGIDRSIFVSDAVSLAGMPAGVYNTPVGGKVKLEASGRLSVFGSDMLAGAATALKDGIARAATMSGMSLADCVRMTTENPGKFTGGRGVLRAGMPADFIRFKLEQGGTALRILDVIAGDTVLSLSEP